MSISIQPSSEQIARIDREIGRGIDAKYETERTPAQSKTIKAIALGAISAVGAAVLLGAGALLLFSWCVITGLALLVLGGALAYFAACFFGYLSSPSITNDLDDPKKRDEIIQDLSQRTFSEVADKFSPRQVIDYALLGPSANAELYGRFEESFKIYQPSLKETLNNLFEQARSQNVLGYSA